MATPSGDAATARPPASAQEGPGERSLSSSPVGTSPSYNPSSSASSLNTKSESSLPTSASGAMESSTVAVDVDPDVQILEALRNKDRLYVLKLGEQLEALIKERRPKMDFNPTSSYQRLLVHRCSAYYRLNSEMDQATKTISVAYRAESRIPTRRICELVPAEESAQPAFQIMRRTDRPLRGRQHSQPGSTTGEDADTSDVDASEAGSVGGLSSAASTSARKYKTIEERTAEYKEARSRIFMGFEEKKEKEKDMSANSSTFSLVSGSGSTSGGRGSSIGDMDDSASSAPTESEWSGPVNRDKRDARRGTGSTNSSVRSMRSSGASYNANGSGSSRNSRATSPSFTYPSLYEPSPGQQYEQGQYGAPAQPTGYMPPYVYPSYNTAAPGQQPYMGQYYYPYPYTVPPQPDPTAAGVHEGMYPPPNTAQQTAYPHPYMWTGPPPQGQLPHGQPPHAPLHLQQHPPQPGIPPGHADAQRMQPPMQNVPQFQQYTPTPASYAYNGVPGYYHQPYQPGAPMGPPPPPMPGQAYHPGPTPDAMPPNSSNAMSMDGHTISRTSSRNSSGHGSVNGKRGGSRSRNAWTYGPGTAPGAFPYTPGGVNNGVDAYGPRLSNNMRRTPGASSAGSSTGARTPADETSSTASSSTSSSSRRTFFTPGSMPYNTTPTTSLVQPTSTSSKHPLPARPDWAVGLKPHNARHHDHHNASRTMSPARMGAGPSHLPPQQQPVLQSTDFPPLSSGPNPAPARQPAPGGAWTNASISRVMTAAPPQGNGANTAQGSALVHYPTSQNASASASPLVPAAPVPAALGRLDEQDGNGFERPPPKHAELFNPKTAGRIGGGAGSNANGRSRANTGANVPVVGFAEQMGALGLTDGDGAAAAAVAAPSPSLISGAGELGAAMGEAVVSPVLSS